MAATRSQLRSWLLRVAAAALGAQLLCAPAKAQRIVASPEYDAMFAQVLREPANLDLSFRFAEVATAAGDYEAAIGALERMLFYNPNLPRVKLELGILYFRLGSYEMARSYFQGALASGPPPEVVSRVQPFLTEIDRRVSTTQWSVFGQLGLRYQTNANAGPT